MKKRIISTALAAFLATSALATSAFAASPTLTNAADHEQEDPNGFEINFTSVIEAPTITVNCPIGDAQFVLNPYKLEVTITPASGTEGEEGYVPAVKSSDQVVSKLMKFENKSNCPVAMFAKAVATPNEEGKATLSTAALKTGDTKNQVLLYVVPSPASATEVTSIEFTPFVANNHLLANDSTKAVEKKMVVLANPAGEGATKFAALSLQGAMSDAPTSPWEADDTVSVVLTYRFEANTNAATS